MEQFCMRSWIYHNLFVLQGFTEDARRQQLMPLFERMSEE